MRLSYMLVILLFNPTTASASGYLGSYDVPNHKVPDYKVENCIPSQGQYDKSDLSAGLKLFRNNDCSAAVIALDQFIDAHAVEAQQMQQSLTEYAWESKAKIFSYAALNDVSLALFIKGKCLEQLGLQNEAVATYTTLIDKYSYGQCWDPQGSFVKPAEEAAVRLDKTITARIHVVANQHPGNEFEKSPEYRAIKESQERLKTEGKVLADLPDEQKFFMEKYRGVLDSAERQGYEYLLAPNIRKCLNRQTEDYFKSQIESPLTDQSRILIDSVAGQKDIYRLQIYTETTTDYQDAKGNSEKDHSITSIARDLYKINNDFFLVVHCPTDQDIKSFNDSQNQPLGEMKTEEVDYFGDVTEIKRFDSSGRVISIEKQKKGKVFQRGEYYPGTIIFKYDSYSGDDDTEGYFKTYYEDGKLKSEVPMINGQWHGLEKHYRRDGILERTMKYIKGMPENYQAPGESSPFGPPQGSNSF